MPQENTGLHYTGCKQNDSKGNEAFCFESMK